MATLIYRKGLDFKHEVAAELEASYRSALVDTLKAGDYCYRSGRLTIHLAREFGFCYGVDRAVDYAYQARRRFPDRPIWLTGEIIHNPHVNEKLRAHGIRFLTDDGVDVNHLSADDVVILPAFGVTIEQLVELERKGCTLVDTTCGSVLNVWKNVRRYAEDGFTSVIHGKYWHEETRATASQAQHAGGHYLVVLDQAEAQTVCDFIGGSGEPGAFMARFGRAASPGFDPVRDLQRVGCANQTTMLSSESLEIGEMFRAALLARYGSDQLQARFRAFDTICSATQDRQDAVAELLDRHHLDLMLVVGGYNSSNTCNLARMCAPRVPTFHIASPDRLESPAVIRHKPISGKEEITATDWMPDSPLVIGLTAGASTPDNLVEAVIRRLDELANGASGPGQATPGRDGHPG